MITRLTTQDGYDISDRDGLPLYKESPLVTPPGKATGALVRDDRPGDLGELFRDRFPKEIVDPSDWAPLIKAGGGDHRKFVPWILDQNGAGSCAAEGLCNCVTTNRERRWGEPERIKFNPWPLYYFSGGGRDNGSSLTANIREAKKRGLVPMKLWPRYGTGAHRWNDVPPSSSDIWREAAKYKPGETYDIGNTVEAASALFAGHSVYAAYPGHAWELIAVLNTTQFAWLNSWGSNWDGDGIGVINASRITYQYGLFAIQTVTKG